MASEFIDKEWKLLLRNMIALNLNLFKGLDAGEKGDSESDTEAILSKIRSWNLAQVGLHEMKTFESDLASVADAMKGKRTFQPEPTDHATDMEEFETMFSNLLGDVKKFNSKHEEAMDTLREMLSFESEHAAVKERLAVGQVKESANNPDEFNANFERLQKMAAKSMEETKAIQKRQAVKMKSIAEKYREQMKGVQPISEEELKPFLDALQG